VQPRVSTQSGDPEADGCDEGKGCDEVLGKSIVSGCNAPPVLQPAEHALDQIASAVSLAVERTGSFSAGARGDNRLDAAFSEQGAEGVGIVGLVSEQPARRLDRGKDRRCNGDVGCVARRQDEGERAAESVSQSVDLARAPAARAADRLRCFPFLPPPAERWALI
jgi:hypothetical protein